MPKKTSRSARALQAQRNSLAGGERKSAARPLVDLETSRLTTDSSRRAGGAVEAPLNGDTTTLEAGEAGPAETPLVQEPITAATRPRGIYQSPARSASTASTGGSSDGATGVIRAASPAQRRPYARRTTVGGNRQPALSRDEEYAYIRSDLLTVFLLTALLLAVLIILTFVIGR